MALREVNEKMILKVINESVLPPLQKYLRDYCDQRVHAEAMAIIHELTDRKLRGMIQDAVSDRVSIEVNVKTK